MDRFSSPTVPCRNDDFTIFPGIIRFKKEIQEMIMLPIA